MEKELNWNKKNQIRFQKYNVRCTITRKLEDDVEYFSASKLSGLTARQISDLNIFLKDDMDKDEMLKLLENLRRYGCRNEGFDITLRYGDCKKTDKEPEPSKYKVQEEVWYAVFVPPSFISPFSIW